MQCGSITHQSVYLSEYFGRLDEARKTLIRKSLYPLFMLHLGIFVTGLPTFIQGFDLNAYLKETLGVLFLIYIYSFGLLLVIWFLLVQGTRSAAIDGFLRLIPGVGKMRRAFALSRFCATYEMQLQSGVNVMDSLQSAGRASQSGMVAVVVAKAVPKVRAGSQVGPLLSGSSAFPENMVRAIKIGEETGSLDAELKQLADSFQQEALSRMDFLAAFLSKAIYILMLVFVGYRIVAWYSGYLHKTMDLMGQ